MKPGDLIEVDLYEFYQHGTDPMLGLFISDLPNGHRKVLVGGCAIRALNEETREIQEGSYIFNNVCKESFGLEI